MKAPESTSPSIVISPISSGRYNILRLFSEAEKSSSVEYALASTVSPKRRRGVIRFLIHRQIWLSFVERRYPSFFLVGNDAYFADRWLSWLHSNNLPFCGVCRSVAFRRVTCVVFGSAIISPCLLPFVASHFSAFCLEMAKFIAVEAVPFFGILGSIPRRFGFRLCLGWF